MSTANPNQARLEFWNIAAAGWIAEEERLDRAFSPLEQAALARAAARAGERVIDVGCGCGASTLRLAERVGPSGSVLGVDISGAMLARARERARAYPQVAFAEGDAALHPFAGDADLLYSRFGVMFFVEPEAAFRNLRRALRPGGRICFLCWRDERENPWYGVPVQVAIDVLGPPPPMPPDAPGPFALRSAERVGAILGAGGFSDLALEPFDSPLTFSTRGIEEAVDFAVKAGPVARMLRQADAAARARVESAMRSALRERLVGDSVALDAAIWIVSARA